MGSDANSMFAWTMSTSIPYKGTNVGAGSSWTSTM